jgi:predicted RNase H-like HicB family nuclease/uncharacterized damage-inducible protein DinB
MTGYSAYLEIANDGVCMAHVPDLPGCFVRASARDEALRRLPDTIRDHCAWLRRHGEPASPQDEEFEIQIAGEDAGVGPFDPGDAAALLPTDREPVTLEEMEWHFRLMGHSRSDLLALASEIEDDVLDWQPAPDEYTIRRLLRHIGNGEKWYVSRIVPIDSLPPEWDADEDLSPLAYLSMERRTALARLRQLTEDERTRVFHPSFRTSHPQEAWTARKVLRRFLEHEREHTAQIREALATYRQRLLARLVAERAGLLEQLLGLEEKELTGDRVLDGWTVQDMLAHIAAWDRWEHQVMAAMASGATPDLSLAEDDDAANDAFVGAWYGRSLTDVLAELQAAREEWVAWLASLPEGEFFRFRTYDGDNWSFYGDPVQAMWRHDAEHAEQIAAWRGSGVRQVVTGSKAVLLAALDAARKELASSAALVPAEERASRSLCGEWTLKDVLGHIADWEWVGVEGLRDMAGGRAPQVEAINDIEAWNQARAEARRNQTWEQVWTDFQATRLAFLEVLQGMDQTMLDQHYPFPWGAAGTAYQWVLVFFRHDRDHARDPWPMQPE